MRLNEPYSVSGDTEILFKRTGEKPAVCHKQLHQPAKRQHMTEAPVCSLLIKPPLFVRDSAAAASHLNEVVNSEFTPFRGYR